MKRTEKGSEGEKKCRLSSRYTFILVSVLKNYGPSPLFSPQVGRGEIHWRPARALGAAQTPGGGERRSHCSGARRKIDAESTIQTQEHLNVEEREPSNHQQEKDSVDDVDASVPYEDREDNIGEKNDNRRGQERGQSFPHSTPDSSSQGQKREAGKRKSPFDAVADSSDDEEQEQGEEIPEIHLKCGASGEPYTTVILLPLCMRCQPFFPLECATTLLFRMALELLKGNKKTAGRTSEARRGNYGGRHERGEGTMCSGGEDDEDERGLRGETDGLESETDMPRKSMRGLSRHAKAEERPEISEREAVLICSQTQLIDHPPYEPAISSHISVARPRRPQEISRRPLQVRRFSPVSPTPGHSFPVSPAPQKSPVSSSFSSSPPVGSSPFSALPHSKEKRDPKLFSSLSLPKDERRSLSSCSPPPSSSLSRGRVLTRRELCLKESPRKTEARQGESCNGETKSVTVRRQSIYSSKGRTYRCPTSVHSRRRRPPGKDLRSRRRSPVSPRHAQLRSSDLRRLDRLKIKYVPLFRSADFSQRTGSSGSSNSHNSDGGLSPLLSLICTIPLLTSTSPPSCFFFLSPSCALAPPPSSSASHHSAQRWYKMESFFETPLPAISCCALSPSRSLSGACCSPPFLPSPFAAFLFYSRLCSVSPSTWALFLSLLVTATTSRFTPPSPALLSTSTHTSTNRLSVTLSASRTASEDPSSGEGCLSPSLSFPPLVFLFEFFPTACCVACCPFSAFSPSLKETMGPEKEQQSSGEIQNCDDKRQADGGGVQEMSDCGNLRRERRRSLETSSRVRASIEEDDRDDFGVRDDRKRHDEGPVSVKETGRGKDQTDEKQGTERRSYPPGEESGNHHQIQHACFNERRRCKDKWKDNTEQDPWHTLDSPAAAAAPLQETNLREDSYLLTEGNRVEEETSFEASPPHVHLRDIGPLPSLEPKSPWLALEKGDMDGARTKDWRRQSVSSSPSPKRKRSKKDWRPAVCREGEAAGYTEEASSSCSCFGEVRLCGIESSKLIRLCRERCCRVVMLLPCLSSPRSLSKEVPLLKQQQQGRAVAGEQEGELHHTAGSHHQNDRASCSSASCGCAFNTSRKTGVGDTRPGREQLREENGVRGAPGEDRESPWIEWLKGRGGYVADLSFPGSRSY